MGHTVTGLLLERAGAHPDRPFLRCGQDRRSYGEVLAGAERLAAGLAGEGVAPGDRVAVIAPNRVELLELYFGCALAGAVQVPTNVFLKGEFLRYQLDDAQAQTVVCDPVGLAALREVADGLPLLERVIVFDDPNQRAPVRVIAYDEFRASPGRAPAFEADVSDLLAIMYTSGTTGLPKGCMLSHGWHVHAAAGSRDMLGYREDDVLYTALPLFHGWARGLVTGALTNGCEAVIDPVFSATAILERLTNVGATVFSGVGMMALAMLGLPASPADRAHRLRLIFSFPLTPEQQAAIEERFGVDVLTQMYGQTETGAIAFSALGGPRKPGTLGEPSPHLDVRVVDDHDEDVPDGEVGEVIVRSKIPYSLYSGYWRKPAETVEAWRNLWHHTGDLARTDEDGYLVFVDRKKDALRRRGENVSSVQLELAIAQHPSVAECAVHALPSAMSEDDIKVCVVLEPDASIGPDELFTFFRERLPYFAIPRYVEVLDELPRNATMRVMKHLLRERGVTEQTWDLESMGLVVARDERR